MSTGAIPALLAGVAAAQPGPVWKLATSDTTVAIGIEDGRPALRALCAAGSPRNWIAAPAVERLMPVIELDGGALKTAWKFQGAELDATKEQLSLRFTNANPRLSLNSIWRARTGHGPVEHWLIIANESGRAITVTHQDRLVLNGLALAAGESAQARWINRGGNNASRQGETLTANTDADFDRVLVSNPLRRRASTCASAIWWSSKPISTPARHFSSRRHSSAVIAAISMKEVTRCTASRWTSCCPRLTVALISTLSDTAPIARPPFRVKGIEISPIRR